MIAAVDLRKEFPRKLSARANGVAQRMRDKGVNRGLSP